MRNERLQSLALLVAVLICGLLSYGEPAKSSRPSATSSAAPASAAAITPEQADSMRLEGEKRFHANCGRCHMAPHKYSPRVMATAVRHMRVRATITDEDMRYILYFLTR
jgi:mono/diheme cytochrome c family protein